MGKKLYVAMYHYTRDLPNSRYPNIKGLDYHIFKEQIDFLCHNFNIVTMEQVIDVWNNEGGVLPEKALLLTFDDGYIDNYLVALPILKSYGIQGSFFIPAKTFNENKLLDVNKIHFILASANSDVSLMHDVCDELDKKRSDGVNLPSNEDLIKKYAIPNRFDTAETIFVKRILQTAIDEVVRVDIVDCLFKKYVGIPEEKFSRELYMNRDQIRFMRSEGMYIGLHGYDHYWLGNLDEKNMKADIDQMLITMDEFIDSNCWVLNYPYGNYNDSVLQYIETKGCKLGMTTEVRVADIERDQRFLLPRLDCNDFPPKSFNFKEY